MHDKNYHHLKQREIVRKTKCIYNFFFGESKIRHRGIKDGSDQKLKRDAQMAAKHFGEKASVY